MDETTMPDPTTHSRLCQGGTLTHFQRCYSFILKSALVSNQTSCSKMNHLRSQSPMAQNVQFPVFNYSVGQVREACGIYKETLEECLTPRVAKACIEHPVQLFFPSPLQLIAYVDEELGVMCSAVTSPFFDREYECLRHVLDMNMVCLSVCQGREHAQGCTEKILGINSPGKPTEDRCRRYGPFKSCISDRIRVLCGSGWPEVSAETEFRLAATP